MRLQLEKAFFENQPRRTLTNQNLEQIAGDRIDQKLELAGCLVQSKNQINLSVSLDIVLRETNTDSGLAE